MTAEEFKIESPEDLARWFKYRSARSEREGTALFKDISAKTHYQKMRKLYDNVYACLANEGLDIKNFVDQYFKIPGQHSPNGLQSITERRCREFYKRIRSNFGKTVRNVCDAMAKKNVSSSLDILKILAQTGMLAPNFLAGKISVFWLAGVHGISDIAGLSKVKSQTTKSLFLHNDDFNSTFNAFLEQREVYYHQLCLAFGGTENGGIDSIAVTDRQFMKRNNKKIGEK